MKKIIFSALFVTLFSAASFAQIGTPHKGKVKHETTITKVKPKTTVSQKVHNTIHPKNKKYSGVKLKEKEAKK